MAHSSPLTKLQVIREWLADLGEEDANRAWDATEGTADLPPVVDGITLLSFIETLAERTL